jgi:peptidyl-prolyl cis-trans isomerase A (cyclophilin A)
MIRSGAAILLGLLPLLAALAGCGGEGGEPNPRVLIRTELGDIIIEVFLDRAPITAANFLKYVREDRFRGATFYRKVTMGNQPDNDIKIEVIQGGLGEDLDGLALPPIEHETTGKTGVLHRDGTVSMARAEPGTAGSEIFICIGDQPELDYGGMRNPDGQGFAAFGEVVEGMDVVLEIHSQPAEGQWLNPQVKILKIVRMSE